MRKNKEKMVIIYCAILLSLIGTGCCIAPCGVNPAGEKAYYVRTEFLNMDTQMGQFRNLKKAKKCADLTSVYGYRVYSANGKIVYATYGELAADILREGKYVADYIRENNFRYGNAPINPAIDHAAKLISCDRLVGWVMYRVGFTNQPYKHGLWIWAPGDEKDLEAWCVLNEFEKVTKQEELLPGDIVFVSRSIKGQPGHTFIHAGVSPDSSYYRYDGGSNGRIQREQPSSEPIRDFMFAYRPVRHK